MVSSKGYLNVNSENIYKVVKEAKKASSSVLSIKYSLTDLEEDLNTITLSMNQLSQRLNVCETLINNLQTGSNNGALLPFQFQMKINKLERRVKTIIRNLARRECQKDPCMNGGTCFDKYLDYECRCMEGWEGRVCEKDVNECAKFAGTDLGCQNGASCINKPGTYECICAAGWYGLHCTRRSNDCSSGSHGELCGHGTCVTLTTGAKGFTCICDQGWTTDGNNPSCSVDVDECKNYPCSRNPLVTCHNTPGAFFCGPCPPGYTGNGFSCFDINECLTENGGCSVQPLVQCINTDGSSTCGPCPPGYNGDGRTCTFVGKCHVDNGGCNPNARCQELGSNIQCQCLPGYTGSGIGPFGCELTGSGGSRNPCSPNPCRHAGRCYVTSDNNYTCTCTAGYTGSTCNIPINPCNSNPCQNGGTCIFRKTYRTFLCRCTSSYAGKYCQKERQSCGGYMNADEGELQFPSANSSSIRYSHNLNCAWIIIVNSSLVINATFDYFDLESAPECQMDWVQIHDGKSAGDHIIGKFCGKDLPNNGTIISSTNYMYMWFKSDGSKSGNGFKLTWHAVNPVCGGTINASIHGTIRSPGSPGKYPPNRDCYWQLQAPFGKRITFTFFEVHIESHQNCSYDYLEFHEGLTLDSPLIARFCNSTIPQPLTTPGSTALVYFHSDEYQSDRGFQIAYHPEPGFPGCGGIFTSRRGEITPPMEEGRYLKNMDCAWLIRLYGNLRVKIEFTFFRLEDERNCNTDFVEVRDGADVTAPLIGRYCGFVTPPVIESEGNVLFVRFYTDNTIEASGFRINYRAICRHLFTTATGVIQSPGYPEKYRNQEDCEFVVEQPPGKIIQLEFQDFEFESITVCYFDYIEIRDGPNERSPLIRRYCGNDRPPLITSSHNYLWIKMVTDKEVEMRGFYANYTTIDIACGGMFTAPEGEISSPSEYGSYPPNHDCHWVIVGSPGEVIQLTFTTFKVEYHNACEFDYVAVYDNSSALKGGGLMGKFCGESVPPLLTTTEHTMTVHFHSDSSQLMEGFTAKYRLVNMSTICGGNYFTNMGVIKSPNYPKSYPNDKTCVWVIRVSNGNKIELNFIGFALEGNTLGANKQCIFDYLEVRDGGYESSPLIGRYCGTKAPKRLVSQSNLFYLKFRSDSTFPNLGFLINWDGTITGCGGTLTSVTGSIISPNYPEPYGANSLCNYKISVAMGSKVTLNIMDLDLENSGTCSMDFIEIFDGPEKRGKSLGKYCSNTNHPAMLTSTRNEVNIKFRSDVTAAGKGFYLKYKTECNTNMTGFRGVIESPNFPEKFPAGTNCTWVIIASPGNKINISFSDFNFLGPCEDDYIEILEGNPRPTNTIGKYCRGKKPPLIASDLSRVFVQFSSSLTSFRGSFRAEWVLNGCGGTFIKPQGEFKSPNYPNIYPPNTECEYYITVDPSMSIVLTIQDISFEALKDCFGDALEIFGGADDTAPLLAKVCQKKSDPILIETSGNEMFVRFRSDQITGGSGFYARYSTKPAACGGQFISNRGYITSRNYPKNYNQMDNCVWTIQVDANHKIRLNFEEFDLASSSTCNDTYVQVFDGPTQDFPVLLKHCGNSLPSPNPIHSTSNFLTIRMTSQSMYTAKGFKANYEMDCGAVIVADEPGVIGPSDYLLTRPDYGNCTWTITSPQPDGHITLTVSYMDTTSESCSDNTLFVYDGSDHNSTLIGAYCGRKTNLPVVTQGNTLFIEFIPSTYSSIHFWATYASASSACGGNLYGETGSFATPGYPSNYPTNSECVWVLRAAPGNKVQLNFKEFDLEQSDHCNEEYVEIREKDAAGKLLGFFCGQLAPTNLTTQSATWIKFRSGSVGTGKKGFLADYNLVYRNEVNGSAGEIANPFYPRPFMHYVENINWRVNVEFGSAIRLWFKDLHLDDFHSVMCISSVTIYDGYDETAPVLLKVCGLVKPEAVTSSSNVVYIVFFHAHVHHGSLFLLEWSKVSTPSQNILPTALTPSKCKREMDMSLFQNNSVTLTNPEWPDSDFNELDCEWLFKCPDYEHLTLTVNVLVVAQYPQCMYSYVGVYSKSDADWREQRRFCLSNETDQKISTDNFMRVTFLATYNDRSLFSLNVQRECGNSIKKTNGVIRFNSKDYSTRGWSPENSFCHWDITVSPGRKIKVFFSEFDFYPSGEGTACTEKYLMVYYLDIGKFETTILAKNINDNANCGFQLRDGGSEDSPLLGDDVHCTFPDTIPLTTSNRLYIKAKTAHQGTSFVMKFEEVSPECGRRIKLDDDFNVTIISSPNYPNIPPSKIECVWTFSTTGGHRLQIDFVDRFDLTSSRSCDEEYVEVRDGGTLLSEELGRFCSDKPSTQKSTGNMLFVKYYTNATNPKNGFKAQVSIARCGGVIRSSGGVLTSPGYPNNYLYDTECTWNIETDMRYKLQVTFEDLHLPTNNSDGSSRTAGTRLSPTAWNSGASYNTSKINCTSSATIFFEQPAPDVIEQIRKSGTYLSFVDTLLLIREKSKNVLLGSVCSNEPVTPIRSYSNKMIIRFQSGSAPSTHLNTPFRGFKLNFTSVGKGCVYRLDTPSGVIVSPGYPNESPNYYFCTWKITVPKGRRITLRVDDFDLPNSGVEQRVLMYNEHRYRSRIAMLTGASKVEPVYKSSSNLMLVTFWSKTLSGAGKRGFKFTYDSDEPQVCGGVLTQNEGFLASPSNMTSFYCKWEFQAKRSENQTIAFYVKDAYIGNRTGTCSIKYGAVLAISGRGRSNYFQEEICGNITSHIVRNPVPYAFVTAIQGAWSGAVIFNVTYKTFSCGGTIYDFETVITTPSYPNNYSPDTDCAWLIYLSPGQTIKLTFEEFNLQPSCGDYLLVKNGPSPKSPLIGQYCGTSTNGMAPITSEGHSLFLEFHSDSSNGGKGFKISIEPGNYVCGGAVHSLGYELMSPNFPSQYDNNQECEWEIRSAEGTHIGLVFVDRFHIESSENCKNDFVKVFDYVDDDWKLLKTLCGREMPSPINSTSSRVKVLFRSNGVTVSDGFKIKWYQNCGGTFTSPSGVILSPGYPKSYKSNLNCTYIIQHQEETTQINFSYFNVEPPLNGRCQYDSVKIYEAKWEDSFELIGIFCGSKLPSPRNLKGTIKIEFVTDPNNNYGGFVLNFKSSKCGSHVTQVQTIEYYMGPSSDGVSDYGQCVWDIVAPPNKIVLLRFDDVNMPFTTECSYPFIDVFDERKNGSFLMGRVCGKLKPKQVVLKSTTNKMSVKLQKPYHEGEGFSAAVYFTYGSSVGCGGEIELDSKSKTIKSPDADGDGFYEEFLECTWIVRAKPFYQIVANFKTFDVEDCKAQKGTPSNFSSQTCSCDNVEIRDGVDHFSESLVLACGSTIPSPVTSSGSIMSIKFSSDGTYHARGFNIELSPTLSQCGVEVFNPQDTIQTLTSPNYPQNYPEGLRCKWTIYDSSGDSNRIIHLHISDWDIVESDNCQDDFMYIEDTGFLKPLYQSPNYEVTSNRSADTAEIIRGNPISLYFYDRSQSNGKVKFCGKGNSIDFYSSSNEVVVGFFSNSGSARKGFKIDYAIAGCTRNYTAEQGHIKNLNFKNNSHCYITIKAPSPNHTISLYFTAFTLKGSPHGDCPVSFLEVRDGADVKSNLIGKYCGYSTPSPIFSTGQNLWLHFYTRLSTHGVDYQNVDITYTTTDKGQGCGGRFFGLSGTVSSPGYPSNTRKNSLCRWDIVIPSGLEEVIQFSVFDIGPSNTCNTDYIEFYEVIGDSGAETFLSRFCGKDNPAVIRSTADVLVIKYATSLHNGGTGWQLEFRALTPGMRIF
ncbi:hypothetical protein RUM43_000609 [Polyplax serrata]|uniref:Cubilin n=1 Tax=Polyplax serrata TaxID=468196 RepID=A0AAN8SD15_POLSC